MFWYRARSIKQLDSPTMLFVMREILWLATRVSQPAINDLRIMLLRRVEYTTIQFGIVRTRCVIIGEQLLSLNVYDYD
jgi:hypothetical protein